MSQNPPEKSNVVSGSGKSTKFGKKLRNAKKRIANSFTKSTTLKDFYIEKYFWTKKHKSDRSNKKNENEPGPSTHGSHEDLSFPNDLAAPKEDENHEEKFQEMCKDIKIGLMYFEVIARKKRMEQFPGSASQILEFVMKILDLLSTVHNNIPRLSTPALMTCRSNLIQNLAKLIHWADTMLLETDSSTQNTRIKTVPDIIDSVRKSVDKLASEAAKINLTPYTSAPVSPTPNRSSSLPDSHSSRPHGNRSSSFAFVSSKEFFKNEIKKSKSNLHASHNSPSFLKKRQKSTLPVNESFPFDRPDDLAVGSLFQLRSHGLTRSEESLLEQNGFKSFLHAQASEESQSSSGSQSKLNGETSDNSTPNGEVCETHRTPLLKWPSIPEDGDYDACNPDAPLPAPSSPQHYPLNPYMSMSPQFVTHPWSVWSNGCSFLDEIEQAFSSTSQYASRPASALSRNPRLSVGSRRSLSSNESENFRSSSPQSYNSDSKLNQESDDEELPPLLTKKNKIDQYMQLFAQSELQPPPLTDIYRETVRRYHAKSANACPSPEDRLTRSKQASLPLNSQAAKARQPAPADVTRTTRSNTLEKPSFELPDLEEEPKRTCATQGARDSSSLASTSSSGYHTSSLHTSESSLASDQPEVVTPTLQSVPEDTSPLAKTNHVEFKPKSFLYNNSVKSRPNNFALKNQIHSDSSGGNFPSTTNGAPGSSPGDFIGRSKPRSNSFLHSLIGQQSYTVTGDIRKPSIEFVTRTKPDRSKMKPRPSTTILETSESSNSVVGAKTIPHEDMNLFNSLTAPRPTTVKKCSANSKMSKTRRVSSFLHSTLTGELLSPKEQLMKEIKMSVKKIPESTSSSSRRNARDDTPCELPPSDPGNLLDAPDVIKYLSFHRHSEHGELEVCGGCCDALLVYAAETSKKNYIFCEAFLTTYRTFITPMDLLRKLLYRRKQFGLELSLDTDQARYKASRNAIFLLLRVVDELSLVDITDEILDVLMQLVYQLLMHGQLMLGRLLRSKVLSKYDHRNSSRNKHSLVSIASLQVNTKNYTIHDFNSEKIAEQMTLLDLELFQKIEIPEVLQWAKNQSEELSPHLTRFTEHFNKMSYWARTVILTTPKPQEREKVLNKFIRIMRHLRKLNNFNSYLAILSALDSAPVRRLEWQKQTNDLLQEYCRLIDSSSSFRIYREALARASQPCIPYLGLILQDLTFIHLGNQDELAPGIINFRKRWQQFNILDTMRRFKQSVYPFRRDTDVIRLLEGFGDYLSEEQLWELSLTIKPRIKRPKKPQFIPPAGSASTVTITNNSANNTLNSTSVAACNNE